MIYLYWRLAFAVHRWLQSTTPMNRLAFAARRSRGPTWLPPVTLLTGLCYFGAAWLCAEITRNGGAEPMNLLVLLCLWNSMKLTASGLAGAVQDTWSVMVQMASQARDLIMHPAPRERLIGEARMRLWTVKFGRVVRGSPIVLRLAAVGVRVLGMVPIPDVGSDPAGDQHRDYCDRLPRSLGQVGGAEDESAEHWIADELVVQL